MSFTPFKNFLHRVYVLQSVLLWAKALRPQPKVSTKLEAIPFNNEHGVRQLQTIFSAFEKAKAAYPATQTYGTNPSLSPESRALFEAIGFWLERRPSRISGAGMLMQQTYCHYYKLPSYLLCFTLCIRFPGYGVFLHGKARAGDIVCMYPGTIYLPGEPILLVSLRNSYILRCYDGIFVDGKSGGERFSQTIVIVRQKI
ncbi:hypothetical protein BC937DRAFT_94989 [Endogone sp. FLAS-F59071]|nr:hypothetical protein BC937DRAFT_94989 [Endogone sp. FLAS-F59071]|eukprot:RUS20540.1 hypothetical protein BC937DRAFT_94989 [Endogone sp. FLAS-F59071]